MASAFFTTKGGAQRDDGDLDGAFNSGKTALSLRDETSHAYLLLGAICIQQGSPEEAKKYFEEAGKRGASERTIDFVLRDAERRRLAV